MRRHINQSAIHLLDLGRSSLGDRSTAIYADALVNSSSPGNHSFISRYEGYQTTRRVLRCSQLTHSHHWRQTSDKPSHHLPVHFKGYKPTSRSFGCKPSSASVSTIFTPSGRLQSIAMPTSSPANSQLCLPSPPRDCFHCSQTSSLPPALPSEPHVRTPLRSPPIDEG